MASDTRIKTNTIYDLLGVQTLTFCIGIQLIEVSNAQCQIGIGEQLNCLGLSESHEQGIDIFLNCAFLQQTAKLVSSFNQTLIVKVGTNDNTRRIKIVTKSLGLAQKFRAEDNIFAVELLANRSSVAHRNRGLNNHNGVRVVLHDQLDHSLDSRCVEVLGVAIVVGRSRNNNKVRTRVCSLCIQSCGQVQFFFCEILLDIVILNRGLTVVDHVHLLRDNIHSSHLMVLGEQCRNRQTNITGTSNRNFIVLFHNPISS